MHGIEDVPWLSDSKRIIFTIHVHVFWVISLASVHFLIVLLSRCMYFVFTFCLRAVLTCVCFMSKYHCFFWFWIWCFDVCLTLKCSSQTNPLVKACIWRSRYLMWSHPVTSCAISVCPVQSLCGYFSRQFLNHLIGSLRSDLLPPYWPQISSNLHVIFSFNFFLWAFHLLTWLVSRYTAYWTKAYTYNERLCCFVFFFSLKCMIFLCFFYDCVPHGFS